EQHRIREPGLLRDRADAGLAHAVAREELERRLEQLLLRGGIVGIHEERQPLTHGFKLAFANRAVKPFVDPPHDRPEAFIRRSSRRNAAHIASASVSDPLPRLRPAGRGGARIVPTLSRRGVAMMSTDRRTFLRFLSSSALTAALPRSIDRALAIPAHNRT